jgi:hypothetical protein
MGVGFGAIAPVAVARPKRLLRVASRPPNRVSSVRFAPLAIQIENQIENRPESPAKGSCGPLSRRSCAIIEEGNDRLEGGPGQSAREDRSLSSSGSLRCSPRADRRNTWPAPATVLHAERIEPAPVAIARQEQTGRPITRLFSYSCLSKTNGGGNRANAADLERFPR